MVGRWNKKLILGFAAIALMGSLTLNPVSAASAQPVINVMIDRAKVMRIPRPASMIIIGNTAIADATIKDSQTLIITGKQYGTTNLIVLDLDGEPIADEVLTVSSATDNKVVVYRGKERSTFSCQPDCEPLMRIGDNKAEQDNLAVQIDTHKKMIRGDDIDLGDSE